MSKKYPRSTEPQTCKACEREKPAKDFATCFENVSGLRGVCRACTQHARRKYLRATKPQRCNECGKFKASKDFHTCATNANGLHSACKACNSALALEANKRRKKYLRTEKSQKCKGCGKSKPPEDFHTDQKRLKGIQTWCIDCNKTKRQLAPKIRPAEKPQKCKGCGKSKPPGNFYKNRYASNGLHKHCKTCEQAERRLRLYDLTPEVYSRMLESQNYACICGKPVSEGSHTDHCHTTGRIRGVLCRNCNTGIGFAKDDATTLGAWVAYLERHQSLEAQGNSQWGHVPNGARQKRIKWPCKPSQRDCERRYRYGLTPVILVGMLEAQNYECICGKPITESDNIDHCHTTGRVRGVLCTNCNIGIGRLQDSPDLIRKHADNLERHQQLEAQGISKWGYVPDST